MTINELVQKLGIQEDKQQQATADVKAFLDGDFVPKARFNEINDKFKSAETTIKERDTQLADLKKNVGDNDALKKQIETLQADNKTKATEAEARYRQLQIDTAVKLSIASDAQDVDIVASLIDRDKLIVGDDGKITAGLSEQLEALRKEKAFLFTPPINPKYDPKRGLDTPGGVGNPFAKETFNMTEQGRMLRENPEQARAMAAEAGVKL